MSLVKLKMEVRLVITKWVCFFESYKPLDFPGPRGPDSEGQCKEWQSWSWRESGGLEAWCLRSRPGINLYCTAVAYNQTLWAPLPTAKCFPRHKDNISNRVMWFSKLLPTIPPFHFLYVLMNYLLKAHWRADGFPDSWDCEEGKMFQLCSGRR